MKRKSRPKMVDDAIVLLSYVSKHRGEPQSARSLSSLTGIPRTTLFHLFTDCQHIIWHTAETYGYDIWFDSKWNITKDIKGKEIPRRSKRMILDVVKRLDKH